MKKEYTNMNVPDALRKRFAFLFQESKSIYISSSGGKDSGVLLNLLSDHRNKYASDRVTGVFHQDLEMQYTVTTDYITRTSKRLENESGIDPYWACLPTAARTALSDYEMYWYPWDDTKQGIWVRPISEYPYVISPTKPFTHYRYRMHQEDLAKQFGRFYEGEHGNDRTVCLPGMWADESLQRYSGFVNKKYEYQNGYWISRQLKDVWCASPLYDWPDSDVWCANYRFDYDYSNLYDLYYKTGLKIDQMRIASPFNDYPRDILNLCWVIDPEIWTRLVGRARGANFGVIRDKAKAMGYRSITLPDGHTQKFYTQFLLDTLSAWLWNNYVKEFNTSVHFWRETGGRLPEETIREFAEKGYHIRRNGISSYTINKNSRTILLGPIPDHTDDIKSTKDIPGWKWMCHYTLKDGHTHRFIEFGLMWR